MRISIATDSGQVAAHFGRCPSYTILDIEDGEVVKRIEVPNPGHATGAIPQYMHENGVDVMIAGGMGWRAQEFFQQFGIRTMMGVSGSIDNVIEQLCSGTLVGGESLCAPGGGKGYGVPKADGHSHE